MTSCAAMPATTSMIGGKGDDFYFVDSLADKITENANEGFDTVFTSLANYTLGANLERLNLNTGATNAFGNTLDNDINGSPDANMMDGGIGNDIVSGASGNDTVLGGAGNDVLFGGGDTDVLKGGLGDDDYYIGDGEGGDTIIELAAQGTDEILAANGYDLSGLNGANIENLTLTGGGDTNGAGNALSNLIVGSSGNNNLTGVGGNDTLLGGNGNDDLAGGDGNDVLDGGLGINLLAGGLGNDIYVLGAGTDAVTEFNGQGTDEVRSASGINLAGPQFENIENLRLTGSAHVGASGNNLANIIIGNSGINGLSGQGGNDTIYGGDGDDEINGGTDNDAMNGGKGDDLYYVDAAGDKVTENANEGHDTVYSDLSSYVLGANVENLDFGGEAGAAVGTGNTLANRIRGNDFANKLIGGSGDDLLDGGAGNDTLVGGIGNDFYVLDSVDDKVTELANQGIDDIRTNQSFDLSVDGIAIENLFLSGSGNAAGTGNALNNYIGGNGGPQCPDRRPRQRYSRRRQRQRHAGQRRGQ